MNSPAPAVPAAHPAEPHCLVERHGAVLVVTMNRPQARNALSAEMMAIMKDAWDEVDRDPEHPGVRAHRRRRGVLRRRRPQGDDHQPPRRRVRRRRRRPAGDRAAAQGPAADQAADRRRRGAGGRRRHRDPAGHRHPGGRRERPVRGVGGPLGAVPAGRVGGPAAPADPLHRRRRDAAHRTAHHRGRGAGRSA